MDTSLDFCDIKPFIRYVQRLCITNQKYYKQMTAYDHRFFYCASGKGVIKVDDREFHISRGYIVVWPSGHTYELLADKDQELVLLGCNFDYTQQFSDRAVPIPPGNWRTYDESGVLEHIKFTDATCFEGPVCLSNMHILEKDVNTLLNEYTRRLSFFREKLSAVFISIMTEVLREHTLENDNIRRSKSVVEEILQYIGDHYADQLTNEDLGRLFNYHPNYINHLVVQNTGMSVHKYLLNMRITRAIELLQTTDMSALEVSYETGFMDYNHFLKYFRQITGYTTTAFREGGAEKFDENSKKS